MTHLTIPWTEELERTVCVFEAFHAGKSQWMPTMRHSSDLVEAVRAAYRAEKAREEAREAVKFYDAFPDLRHLGPPHKWPETGDPQ